MCQNAFPETGFLSMMLIYLQVKGACTVLILWGRMRESPTELADHPVLCYNHFLIIRYKCFHSVNIIRIIKMSYHFLRY